MVLKVRLDQEFPKDQADLWIPEVLKILVSRFVLEIQGLQ